MPVRLTVIVGPDRGQQYRVGPNGTLNVGRSHATDTKLSDAAVSRLHCRIEFDGKSAVLYNVSAKGTRVNDTPATQQELHHGDIIRVGDSELRFALSAMAEAETLLQYGGSEESADGTNAQPADPASDTSPAEQLR